MSELCLITTCMSRLAHLQQSLGAAAAQPGCSCVVVDYSCPEHCGDWVEQHYPNVKLVRLPDQTLFNGGHARNLGAAAADAPWLCFFDADVILSPHFSARMLPLLQAGNYYLVDPWSKELCGTVICPRGDYQHIGGYDEILVNWGGGDLDLFDRLTLRGLTARTYPQELVTVISHADDLRVQNYAVKSPEVSHISNTLYRLAKLDLMRLVGRDLSDAELRNLFAEATESVQLWLQNRQESQWRIAFRPVQSLHGHQVTTTLVYSP